MDDPISDMVSQILVPMDDSEYAGQAVEYALNNFPDADVSVLHVVGVPSPMMDEATAFCLANDFEEAAAERAEPVFERAREIATERDREVDTMVGIGHPARNIIDHAENYDTIVLGAHGADWSHATHRFLVGNVAETASKRAPIPVIIVRRAKRGSDCDIRSSELLIDGGMAFIVDEAGETTFQRVSKSYLSIGTF